MAKTLVEFVEMVASGHVKGSQIAELQSDIMDRLFCREVIPQHVRDWISRICRQEHEARRGRFRRRSRREPCESSLAINAVQMTRSSQDPVAEAEMHEAIERAIEQTHDETETKILKMLLGNPDRESRTSAMRKQIAGSSKAQYYRHAAALRTRIERAVADCT